jgi:dolichol-phosphate mannosyltransferase
MESSADKTNQDQGATPLSLFSLVIPARNEEGCILPTLLHTHKVLKEHGVPHELVVVDDGSSDSTWAILENSTNGHGDGKELAGVLKPIKNHGENGIGRAISLGLSHASGDAITIMMADASDSPHDAVTYWKKLNEGHDCVFGSRFIPKGKVVDYPKIKLLVNRFANAFIRILFNHGLNDTTNAFKAYRRTTIEGIKPILSPHFNITVELPLKAIVRKYSYTIVPISWHNRKAGESKLKIKEMGSRYLFIVLSVWLEKYFSRGDYNKREESSK